jgi:hypothetical protein
MVRRNLHQFPQDLRQRSYQSLVRPRLEYASCVWDPHQQGQIDQLEAVERKAARFVMADYQQQSSVTAMMDSLGWQSLQQRRWVPRMTLLHRTIMNTTSVVVPSYFQTVPCQIQQGSRNYHPLHFPIQSIKLDCYHYSFFPHAIRCWNILPIHMLEMQNSDTFKQSLWTNIINNQLVVATPGNAYAMPSLSSRRQSTTV